MAQPEHQLRAAQLFNNAEALPICAGPAWGWTRGGPICAAWRGAGDPVCTAHGRGVGRAADPDQSARCAARRARGCLHFARRTGRDERAVEFVLAQIPLLKLLILLGFVRYPQEMWITMWTSAT